jgi:magnesium chelatase family protein
MLSRVLSGAVLGIDAYLVRVEADVSSGLPAFAMVGLAQGALREAEKRVVAAVKNSGFEVPPRRITINLAPADATKAKLAEPAPTTIDRIGVADQLAALLGSSVPGWAVPVERTGAYPFSHPA